jgi:hypothetical protein
MEKDQIRSIVSHMSSEEDLLALLNQIKLDEMTKSNASPRFFHPFTMKQLSYYSNPKHKYNRYHQFIIRKKTGGYRLVSAPTNKSFMMMLQAVNELLRTLYVPSDHAMGFIRGRSIVTNADFHRGQNYVFNLDLKDFFTSISKSRVCKRLQLAPFFFHKKVAELIAGLCSIQECRACDDGRTKTVYVLPQGAPTSPLISNAICDTLDRLLTGISRRFGLRYTRYADDITFSSMHNVYAEDGEFRQELSRIIEKQGFVINDNKIRLQKRGTRQTVTGIIVNQKLNVCQRYARDIRNLLYIWEKYGYLEADSKFKLKYKKEKGHIKKGIPNMQNVLIGKLLYLKMVKGKSDSVYMRLNGKFQTIVSKDTTPKQL